MNLGTLTNRALAHKIGGVGWIRTNLPFGRQIYSLVQHAIVAATPNSSCLPYYRITAARCTGLLNRYAEEVMDQAIGKMIYLPL